MTILSWPEPERNDDLLACDPEEQQALYAAAKDRQLQESRLSTELAEHIARIDLLYIRDAGPKALDELPPQLASEYRDAAAFALRFSHPQWREMAHLKTLAYFKTQLAEHDLEITRRGQPLTERDERLGLELIVRRTANHWIWTLMGHIGLTVLDLVRLETKRAVEDARNGGQR